MLQKDRAETPGSESAPKNTEYTKHTDSVSRVQDSTFADAVGARIDGGQAASRFLFLMSREYLDPDALSVELVKSHAIGPEHHIGFARALQKALERALGSK